MLSMLLSGDEIPPKMLCENQKSTRGTPTREFQRYFGIYMPRYVNVSKLSTSVSEFQ